MDLISQIIFIVVLILFAMILGKRISRIRSNIQLGKPSGHIDQRGHRWKNVVLLAFGQKKMFKDPGPAIFHFFIYAGFLLINIEVLEIILDGIFGTHRMFAFLGDFYTFLISFFEFMAWLVIIACIIFLIRRNITHVPRFKSREMKGWPSLDGNLILVFEIILMAAILSMNAADQVLQERGISPYIQTGTLVFSAWMKPMFEGLAAGPLMITERAAWWLHILGILAFAIYVTYSKHLHIFMAFPTTFYARLSPKGQMDNMAEITNEVKIMLGMPDEGGDPPPEGMKFGAKDVQDLSRVNLMSAYACTECGRCTAQCPANITGKKLSPRKIMMEVRDRMEDVGSGKGVDDNRSLLGHYITKEEINACTSCNACVEACPVSINPLDIILQLRRYVAMEESGSPASWNAMFSNVETNFAPWKFSAQDRFKWAEEMKKDQ